MERVSFIPSFIKQTLNSYCVIFLELIVIVNKAKQTKTKSGITYPLWRKGRWEKTRGRIRLLVYLLCICISAIPGSTRWLRCYHLAEEPSCLRLNTVYHLNSTFHDIISPLFCCIFITLNIANLLCKLTQISNFPVPATSIQALLEKVK